MSWINHANAFGTAGLETIMMRDSDFIMCLLRDWIYSSSYYYLRFCFCSCNLLMKVILFLTGFLFGYYPFLVLLRVDFFSYYFLNDTYYLTLPIVSFPSAVGLRSSSRTLSFPLSERLLRG